ncbi:MAG TPA: hypothetical protein VK858_16580 [Longimicrobiales bacterium]|nr:hypothetical protein [Longimicrobiales bacterium]
MPPVPTPRALLRPRRFLSGALLTLTLALVVPEAVTAQRVHSHHEHANHIAGLVGVEFVGWGR